MLDSSVREELKEKEKKKRDRIRGTQEHWFLTTQQFFQRQQARTDHLLRAKSTLGEPFTSLSNHAILDRSCARTELRMSQVLFFPLSNFSSCEENF